MPASGTLFLTGGSPVEISRMFGMLYGQRARSALPGATPGLWSLAEDDAPVPHFLLRLTGLAAPADFLPGFRQVAIKALAMASPCRREWQSGPSQSRPPSLAPRRCG
jgi:hypothetical protein